MSSATAVQHQSTRAQQRRARRLGALAVGLVVMATSLVVGGAPAGAAAPDAPRVLSIVGYTTRIRIWIAPPVSNGGSPITKYTISRVRSPLLAGETPTTFEVTNTGMFTDPTSLNGSFYRYTVTATNADGTSSPSKAITVQQLVALTDYSKFESTKAFITYQYKDVLGREPTTEELDLVAKSLTNKSLTPDKFLEDLFADGTRSARVQVLRLYLAYFRRSADSGGLAFWTRQLQNGRAELDDVSNAFAKSSEFRNTYGSLSNDDFVALVYANVLGREPEPTGFDFWTRQLEDRLAIRGRVMTQFSESNEFVVSSRGKVQAADVWNTLIGTNISLANLELYASHLDGGGTQGGLATMIIALPQYVVE